MEVNDGRQRTRSLTSVPDLHPAHMHPYNDQGAASSGIHYYQDIVEDPNDSVGPNAIHSAVNALGLGRVYTQSLPSQIFGSLNGKLAFLLLILEKEIISLFN